MKKNPTIAVIEDNSMVADSIVDSINLGNPNVKVEWFKHPKDFLESGKDFDLIIADYDYRDCTIIDFEKQINFQKVIIFTGSLILIELDALGVVSKGNNIGLKVSEILAGKSGLKIFKD